MDLSSHKKRKPDNKLRKLAPSNKDFLQIINLQAHLLEENLLSKDLKVNPSIIISDAY